MKQKLRRSVIPYFLYIRDWHLWMKMLSVRRKNIYTDGRTDRQDNDMKLPNSRGMNNALIRFCFSHGELPLKLGIFHRCMMWIEKSITRVTDWHHEACRVLPNSDPE